jgi:hypothetical protein
MNTATVKSFEVTVEDGQFNIDLNDVGGAEGPLLSALRILQAEDPPPRIDDILVYGSDWTREPYSFKQLSEDGLQLAPIFTEGVDTIQFVFSEDITGLEGEDFSLAASDPTWLEYNRVAENPFYSFVYDSDTHIATWTWENPLPGDKYRIWLWTDATDDGGNRLDIDWSNLTGGTFDDFTDDPEIEQFPTGNGVPDAEGTFMEFFFSLLPGDYNQDGIVTTADQSVSADGDGDGTAGTQADLDLVNSNLNMLLPASKAGGDYWDDEKVNENDYLVWRMNFGATGSNQPGDGNGDGFVDAADYVIWSDHRDDFSAWYDYPAPSGGGGGPVVQFGVAPQVVNVTISGSESLHDPYSFENVVGSGEQLRTVPVGGADTISISFSEDVNVSAGSLDLVGLYTAYRPELLEFIYDLGTMTATWRFEFIEQGDLYLVSLSDAVTDVEGDHLDGEWVNPASLTTTNAAVSEFPSGNGEGGGNFNFVVALLPGDANLDLQVNGSDYMIIGPNYFMGQPGMEFINGDFDGDGVVTAADSDLFVLNYGTNLQSVWVLADLDGDFQVDQDDLDLLYDNWAAGLEDPTVEDGDLNGDGTIDVADLDLMFAQFGLALGVVS